MTHETDKTSQAPVGIWVPFEEAVKRYLQTGKPITLKCPLPEERRNIHRAPPQRVRE
ncbi:MAG: hypothetical protein PHX68_00115 [Alphaproteobacteria bacterium]|nr:hypothetical protein [Alphaproteobacteria bacterium]